MVGCRARSKCKASPRGASHCSASTAQSQLDGSRLPGSAGRSGPSTAWMAQTSTPLGSRPSSLWASSSSWQPSQASWCGWMCAAVPARSGPALSNRAGAAAWGWCAGAQACAWPGLLGRLWAVVEHAQLQHQSALLQQQHALTDLLGALAGRGAGVLARVPMACNAHGSLPGQADPRPHRHAPQALHAQGRPASRVPGGQHDSQHQPTHGRGDASLLCCHRQPPGSHPGPPLAASSLTGLQSLTCSAAALYAHPSAVDGPHRAQRSGRACKLRAAASVTVGGSRARLECSQ